MFRPEVLSTFLIPDLIRIVQSYLFRNLYIHNGTETLLCIGKQHRGWEIAVLAPWKIGEKIEPFTFRLALPTIARDAIVANKVSTFCELIPWELFFRIANHRKHKMYTVPEIFIECKNGGKMEMSVLIAHIDLFYPPLPPYYEILLYNLSLDCISDSVGIGPVSVGEIWSLVFVDNMVFVGQGNMMYKWAVNMDKLRLTDPQKWEISIPGAPPCIVRQLLVDDVRGVLFILLRLECRKSERVAMYDFSGKCREILPVECNDVFLLQLSR